jgi:hypothetical protein
MFSEGTSQLTKFLIFLYVSMNLSSVGVAIVMNYTFHHIFDNWQGSRIGTVSENGVL